MLIDGTAIALTIETKLKEEIKTAALLRKPGLAFVLVGKDPASIAYVTRKKKKCSELGILSFDVEFPSTISEKDLLEEIATLNANPRIDGILVQLPLPPGLSASKILSTIDPAKDVDGFHPINMGKLLLGETDGFLPCTPYGIVTLLAHSGIHPEGTHTVIVGRSNIVGKPLAMLLSQKRKGANATITLAHSGTKNLKQICSLADILIAAIGSPRFITADMVKSGAVVIDVGINREEKTLVGDVDFINVASRCSYITPVPGGVGPMTIAMLLSNTWLSYKRREKNASHHFF